MRLMFQNVDWAANVGNFILIQSQKTFYANM